MANSVLKDLQGPDWPLGFVSVTTPGTPVSIMTNVDASGVNDPKTLTTSGSNEYTVRAQQIIFQAVKPTGSSPAYANNSGLVYLVRRNAAIQGSGNRADAGVVVKVLVPGETFFLAVGPQVNDAFSPYRYSVDADTSGDGLQVTLLIF